MGKTLRTKAASGKTEESEVKRRVAGDDSYYTFVLQRYDGLILPDVAIRLPSVTSIIKSVMGASGGGMAYWGFKLGGAAAHLAHYGEDPTPEEIEALYAASKSGPYAPNRQRDKAGDRGNAAHDVLEGLARGLYRIVEGEDGYALEGPDGAFTPDGYGQAVMNWWMSEAPVPVATEQVLYSLTHRYSGSVDLIARRGLEGRLVLTDLKTHKPAASDGPAYAEDRIQVQAYRHAWGELGFEPIDQTSVLIACEDGSWKEDWKELPFDVFLALREAYAHLTERRIR